MEEESTVGWIGISIQIFGLLLLIPGGVLLYLRSIEDAERRRAAGEVNYTPYTGRDIARVLREEPDEADLPRLRRLAVTLKSRRPAALLLGAATVSQLGGLVFQAGRPRLVFAVLCVVLIGGQALHIERNARIAQRFLQAHPDDPTR
ncbi:hypothetical protein [Kineosporia sp. NBRC 101731]|uniref:hypothetical protein n=1 Tax=Kineosporia sp. NBRC 101731 TaxID=3032199 RepID=UPI0025524923|nr:hypothetical protein [Kineosporia sp. NBRC 101731]